MSTASTAPTRRRTRRPTRYDRLTHEEAIQRDLKVMDATAFALARENRMPIIVFSIREPGAIAAVLDGKGRADIRRLKASVRRAAINAAFPGEAHGCSNARSR